MTTITRRNVTQSEDRWLIHHAESDNIFECFTKKELKQHLSEGCEEVSGIKEYEEWFRTGKAPALQTVSAVGLPLHAKYRPGALKHVVGQKEVVHSLEVALKSKTLQHSYLFTGPSGCGKTTIARIIAKDLGCNASNIIETDAATNTGIDSMREITSTLRYAGFGDLPNKMIILDEAHQLSKQAWSSLLKSVEEPPPHVFFAFCTTEEGKVPAAIKTRCASYNLKSVRFDDLMDLLEGVVSKEKMDPLKGSLELIARACDGSPRKALVLLEMTHQCDDLDEVARLLESPLDDAEIIDLCRLLVGGKLDWVKVTSTLNSMPDTNPESIRIVIVNYLNRCLLGSSKEKETMRLLDMLSPFMRPCNPSDKLAPILMAFGDIIFP